MIVKLSKASNKEKMLKANTEKRNLKYKGTNITMTTDFSSETMKARKQWGHILKVLKGKKSLNLSFYNQWKCLSQWRWNKTFFRHIKIFNARNIKDSPSGRRKMISGENMDPHKAIRVSEMQFFLIFLFL